MMNIIVELKDGAKLPTKKNKYDAGYDLYTREVVSIKAHQQKTVSTGVEITWCSPRLVLFIWPKSGLDAIFGAHIGAGVIDAGYRGEILVLLKNMSDTTLYLRPGDAIAQLVPQLLPNVHLREGVVVTKTERGKTGGIVLLPK